MKKILFLMTSFSIIIFSFFLFSYDNNPEYVEMISEVSNQEEARYLSSIHNIDLLDYSDYGFARYRVAYDQSKSLLSKGFEIDETLHVMARWTPTTSDPFIKDQYALDLMAIKESWLLTEGSSDVIIAIIDTGIDTDHEEFSGRILQNSYNSRTKISSTTSLAHVEDDNGHGTMVAGIIGANKDNSRGIAGIVQHSKLLVIKANNLDNPSTEDDESQQFLESSIAEGIHYARQQGAHIINLSLGTKSTSSITKSAVDQALAEGIIIIGASGNDGDTTKYYPASYPGVISIGSVDSTKTRSTFSNYNDAVTVTAPGSSIVSSSLNNGYATGSGTSFAAPQVTGVIGLMISLFPTMSADQIKSQLIGSVMDQGAIGYDIYYGYGIVHAAQAMNVNYVTITFETYGGTSIPLIQVVSGFSFEIDDPQKEGYSFSGWYQDPMFQTIFQVGVDTTTSNMTLYAKFDPLLYHVTFVVDQMVYQVSDVYHGDIVSLPIPEEPEGYDFVGWFYTISGQTPYQMEPIQQSLTLYARFEPKIFTITYYQGQIVYNSEEVIYQNYPNPSIPNSVFPFVGWYYDQEFVNKYQLEPVTSSFNLYARFHDGQYTVTFYDYDHVTVLSTSMTYYGFSAVEPDHPQKPNSPSFQYYFLMWSEEFQEVQEDLSIYPIYEKIYLKNSIFLLPGVDTVDSLDLFEDAGLSVIDSELRLETHMLKYDDHTYVVMYHIYTDDEIIDVRYRMVSVIPKEQIVITVNPSITTLHVGSKYDEQGATANIGQVEVISDVNHQQPGVYRVIYRVTYQDLIVEKSQYVYILSHEEFHPVITVYYRKEERWWDA